LRKAGQEFTLSSPVAGMEDLVTAVGSSSGRFGSKFPKNPSNSTNHNHNDTTSKVGNSEDIINMNKRQKQKKKWQHEL
jgi:hypothetical protein